MISAHWYINATAVTAMPRPKTIHDFYGFPDELFDVQYPAPGDPELAEEIADLVRPDLGRADADSLGHRPRHLVGARARVPEAADIPVVQLSINADKAFDYHLELGAKLAPLRERGVLIVASGNVVHNLRRHRLEPAGRPGSTGRSGSTMTRGDMSSAPAELATLDAHGDYRDGGAHARPLHPAALPGRSRRGRARGQPPTCWSTATR